MRKSRFTESQILGVLKEGENGVPVAELLRKHGIRQPDIARRPTPQAWRLCPPCSQYLGRSAVVSHSQFARWILYLRITVLTWGSAAEESTNWSRE